MKYTVSAALSCAPKLSHRPLSVIRQILVGCGFQLDTISNEHELTLPEAAVVWTYNAVIGLGLVPPGIFELLICENKATWIDYFDSFDSTKAAIVLAISDRRYFRIMPGKVVWRDIRTDQPVNTVPNTFEGITYNLRKVVSDTIIRLKERKDGSPPPVQEMAAG